MNKCLTIQLTLLNVSGCLVEKPECDHAHRSGFGFICRHPEHSKFHAHATGELSKQDALERYDNLRRKRRDEFTASLDETSREFFCRQTDFFGQPLSNLDFVDTSNVGNFPQMSAITGQT